VSIESRYLDDIRTGELVQCRDGETGEVWKGKVLAITHRIGEDGLPSTTLRLRGPYGQSCH